MGQVLCLPSTAHCFPSLYSFRLCMLVTSTCTTDGQAQPCVAIVYGAHENKGLVGQTSTDMVTHTS